MIGKSASQSYQVISDATDAGINECVSEKPDVLLTRKDYISLHQKADLKLLRSHLDIPTP